MSQEIEQIMQAIQEIRDERAKAGNPVFTSESQDLEFEVLACNRIDALASALSVCVEALEHVSVMRMPDKPVAGSEIAEHTLYAYMEKSRNALKQAAGLLEIKK